jgi:hypothetical protein
MNSNSTKNEIRKFGIVALLFFGMLAGFALWREKSGLTIFFGVLSCLGMCFLVMPGPFRPIYDGWIKIAHFIGKIITVSILTLSYYMVITPAALLKRAFGGRPLPLKPDPNTDSYWIARKEPSQPKERFYLRY